MAVNTGKDAVSESLQTKSSVAETVKNQDNAPPTQVLTRAVVVEVLYDLAAFPPEDVEEMKALVNSPEMLPIAPRNSIIARPISNGADKQAAEAKEPATKEEKEKAEKDKEPVPEKEKVGEVGVLAYPFFPPHLCMPLKPGEQVWLVSDTPDLPQAVMYWMCRISEPDHVDDINYTHSDRRLVGTLAPKTAKDKAEAAEKASNSEGKKEDNAANRDRAQRSTDGATPGTENKDIRKDQPSKDSSGQAESEKESFDKDGDGIDDRIFGFPNGTDEPDAFTLKEEKAYEEIVNIATGYRQFRPQAVPRYTKRPGDLVLQGSNNTLICLGEERGWTKDDDPSSSEYSNATEDEGTRSSRDKKAWGTIDIVAGRGRYNWRFTDGEPNADPAAPAARTILNTPAEKGRAPWVEVNKNPQESKKADSNSYDNPSEGDPDFFSDASRIIVAHSSDIDKNFSIDESGATIPTPIMGSFDIKNKSGNNPAYILSKSDEIRLVARKTAASEPVPNAPEINGSIRIIKEGSPSEDLGAILMLPDGTIQISGSKIVLGRATDDGGRGQGPAEGEAQPYVRYSDLEKLWQAFMDEMTTFCDTVLTHGTPGYGAPSPQINAAAQALKGAISSTHRPDIVTVKSERIFGE